MKTIKKYATMLKLFSILIVIPLMLWIFIRNLKIWIQGNIPKKILLHFPILTKRISPMTKTLGVIIDLVPFFIFFLGIYYFIKILDHLKKGNVFTTNTFYIFKKLTKIALIWVIYHPLSFTLLGLVMTLNNPKGYRYLSVNISSYDALNILLFGLFLIVTSLMHEGLKLKKEQDLTV
ncbi:DUF2975 domain-containing protein [Candidatus Dependentiae bacterium]|nr:DUF2975 domain-containing protein [Candidatus Dependentiae bacterium]